MAPTCMWKRYICNVTYANKKQIVVLIRIRDLLNNLLFSSNSSKSDQSSFSSDKLWWSSLYHQYISLSLQFFSFISYFILFISQAYLERNSHFKSPIFMFCTQKENVIIPNLSFTRQSLSFQLLLCFGIQMSTCYISISDFCSMVDL